MNVWYLKAYFWKRFPSIIHIGWHCLAQRRVPRLLRLITCSGHNLLPWDVKLLTIECIQQAGCNSPVRCTSLHQCGMNAEKNIFIRWSNLLSVNCMPTGAAWIFNNARSAGFWSLTPSHSLRPLYQKLSVSSLASIKAALTNLPIVFTQIITWLWVAQGSMRSASL